MALGFRSLLSTARLHRAIALVLKPSAHRTSIRTRNAAWERCPAAERQKDFLRLTCRTSPYRQLFRGVTQLTWAPAGSTPFRAHSLSQSIDKTVSTLQDVTDDVPVVWVSKRSFGSQRGLPLFCKGSHLLMLAARKQLQSCRDQLPVAI